VAPLNEYDDDLIWDALRAAHLDKEVENMEKTLSTEAAGAFSVGQKQLLCLARAVIRNPRILILDEVTANVDIETDHKIQQTIRDRFVKKGCTQMSIAHRLDTIIDSDKILVMEEGMLAEYDHPHKLLQNEEGIFTSLVESDKENAHSLRAIAEESFQRIEKDPDYMMKRMEEMEKEKLKVHEEKIKAAVPEKMREAVSDIKKKLTQYDEDLHIHPHDKDAKLKLKELWSVLDELREAMERSEYHRTGEDTAMLAAQRLDRAQQDDEDGGFLAGLGIDSAGRKALTNATPGQMQSAARMGDLTPGYGHSSTSTAPQTPMALSRTVSEMGAAEDMGPVNIQIDESLGNITETKPRMNTT